ncbi:MULTISPECIES: DUF5665 domain-containing protein [Alkalihalophilus]|uniref:Uncharacterized protein n=2 Tax=Alkalihalophilus pseudofirmus TaxID=79885 RepID=D3FSY0_ALKPO|nr:MULTISPECIES: DUF5665 domain-containing protein [Alkalihalophilus]ADC51845.1 hypothetical protein BpOF4_19030 [Alkalihalophilus pseudofirmus OF4]MDV2885098.1 DUF5665 domain-containing protein [Alkalihalophilus pseudofirmus]MEC2073659.1 DUF5665 domain-containing protein [Alkalihalophilus marmarensis]MED1599718.1 DUF5665 domain-containing protein [Alkalihalophilus marmarensis]OLS37640.1 hypothetical protein BTR22_09260 [Alkalihalophilus pseudofirmus]
MGLRKEQEQRKLPPKHRSDEKRHDENERFEKLLDKLEDMTTNGRLKDMAYHFTDKKEVIKTNLLAGIARGVGLTIGTAIFIGLFIFILTQMISLPIVGEWVAEFLEMVDQYREQP